MSKAEKLLLAMMRNPAGDWRISDVEVVCKRYGLTCQPPTGGGSHYRVSHPKLFEILTIPARRPIKPIYIKQLVAYIDRAVRPANDP
ncbi:MAG: type II toxin-antitoxin system HicA family toxin [Pseudomonadota bacterium]